METRKIIQIVGSPPEFYALCNDGTVFDYYAPVQRWTQVAPIPQPKLKKLPEDIVAQLKSPWRVCDRTRHILELFENAKRLTVDEVITLLYEVYGVQAERRIIQSTLYNLTQKGLLTKLSTNLYKKAKVETNVCEKYEKI